MRINEFLSNEYVNLFYFHNFQSYLFHWGKFKPAFKIISHAGWGLLGNPASQLNVTYKTMDKGYYESGFEINNILNSLGIGWYYRYGPYSLNTFKNNYAIKITI